MSGLCRATFGAPCWLGKSAGFVCSGFRVPVQRLRIQCAVVCIRFFFGQRSGFVRRTGFGWKFVGLRLEFSVLDFRVVSGLGGFSSSSHLDKPCMALHAKALKVTAGGCTCTS